MKKFFKKRIEEFKEQPLSFKIIFLTLISAFILFICGSIILFLGDGFYNMLNWAEVQLENILHNICESCNSNH